MKGEKSDDRVHQHKGKSSERLVDKERILTELDIVPGQTILDAGCGNGYMAKEFAKRLQGQGRVYALDPDEAAIAVLSQEVKGTIITPIWGDITKTTELGESSIDCLYLAAVLHGFSPKEIAGFQTEARRLLKPKGLLAIVEINKEPTPFGPPLHIRYAPEELKEILPLVPKKTVVAGEFFYMQIFENDT